VADFRITSGSQTPGALAPVQPTARAEAIKAAQRAFFNTALAEAQAQAKPAAAPRVAASAPVVQQPTVTRLHATVDAQTAPPDRILRPGSLLDIKV
jgi:hypothetical protein